MSRAINRRLLTASLAGTGAALVLGLAGAPQAQADERPSSPSAAGVAAARHEAHSPEARDALSRFFARDGKVAPTAADPEIAGKTVPVYYLSPKFVAGDKEAPIGRLQFLASEAISSDGQKASLWTVQQAGHWQVVNIATGNDETRYVALGERTLAGGTVFREPQIDAWYVQEGERVLPLNDQAQKAVGKQGTTLDAYRERVHAAYGDKLPGSAYDRTGQAGGFDEKGARAAAGDVAQTPAPAPQASTEDTDPALTTTAWAGAGTLGALGLGGAWLRRTRRSTR
ncbi:hypothetical protein [Streptomyces pakalii]|uniref:MYXO-CTERM domain-containing protein n=1 Tax=Streptomyces pakalii TaxID=3036494 RepID=A0ABT7DHF8_9ACTN|nr:hypothetical protein [Streptomyces pakalii]MDJ1645268.1 hypothetical protein [Streptomyces pakalii]